MLRTTHTLCGWGTKINKKTFAFDFWSLHRHLSYSSIFCFSQSTISVWLLLHDFQALYQINSSYLSSLFLILVKHGILSILFMLSLIISFLVRKCKSEKGGLLSLSCNISQAMDCVSYYSQQLNSLSWIVIFLGYSHTAQIALYWFFNLTDVICFGVFICYMAQCTWI